MFALSILHVLIELIFYFLGQVTKTKEKVYLLSLQYFLDYCQGVSYTKLLVQISLVILSDPALMLSLQLYRFPHKIIVR